MARRAFYSFHYEPDNSRAAQVRNMGMVDGNTPVSDNDWETVTKGGDAAIKKWIANQMHGRSCTVVLVGSSTAGRKWINHEICKSWDDKMGVVGIHIHGLKNLDGKLRDVGPVTRQVATGAAHLQGPDPPDVAGRTRSVSGVRASCVGGVDCSRRATPR